MCGKNAICSRLLWKEARSLGGHLAPHDSLAFYIGFSYRYRGNSKIWRFCSGLQEFLSRYHFLDTQREQQHWIKNHFSQTRLFPWFSIVSKTIYCVKNFVKNCVNKLMFVWPRKMNRINFVFKLCWYLMLWHFDHGGFLSYNYHRKEIHLNREHDSKWALIRNKLDLEYKKYLK